MKYRVTSAALLLLALGCGTDTSTGPATPGTSLLDTDDGADKEAGTSSDLVVGGEPVTLTTEQIQLGCMIMGEGETAHVMCNHGHSLNFRSENLYARWQFLDAMGMEPISEADLMMTGLHAANGLPEPLTPLLRATVGERVRIRLISYGPEMHDFHVHGHVWIQGDGFADTQPLMPAQVSDAAEFYAGAGADDSAERSGPGDWMYHCHVETHVTSGMWGIFRVFEPGKAEAPGDDGRYPTELPAPIGKAGETVDVWVVAAEVPLSVTREYLDGVGFSTVDRLARIYVQEPHEAAFLAATAASIKQDLRAQKETLAPWVLVLRLGATVRIHLRNVMPEAPVTLHPHGVKYDIGGDGTMPESVVWPGGAPVVAEWTADTPGTWPLHDHARTLENVGRGLFSAIVVKTPEEEAELDRDYLLIFHDFDGDWMMGLPSGSGGHGGH